MRRLCLFYQWCTYLGILLLGSASVNAQSNPYKAPRYWSPYEYHITKELGGESSHYLPEEVLSANIDWLEANLKSYGYTMVCTDGWGDTSKINENGYRSSHSAHWQHDYAWWSNYLQSKGMTLGMYENPLWIHVDKNDTTKKIVGTDINVSSLIDPNEESLWFTWVQVDRPGAEQYVKGYVKYYADMGIKYLRVDFLSWFESGYDRNIGTVGPDRPHEQYVTALRWMREACDENGVYLSLVMPNLFNNAEVEKTYGHLIRINDDAREGGWQRFSDSERGHHFETWSQYANPFDGFTYWSRVSGRNKVQLDGDFLMMNSYANDTEKRTVISLNALAGGPITVADQYNTIGNDLWLYQNQEILDLLDDKFVAKPLSNDPTNVLSQTWRGQLLNGDHVVGLFNRESTPQVRSLNFSTQLGIQGEVMVRDLWQHANLGKMNQISVTVPPHGVVVLKLTKNSNETCNPQTITFPAIEDQVYNAQDFSLSASSTSELPIQYEIVAGPATIVNNKVHLTGFNGTVYVQAKQAGNSTFCGAIPQLQSFNVAGGHQSQMYVGGSFTGWALKGMSLENNIWTLKNQLFLAGDYELKFANTSDWTGKDWGNANGLNGTAQETTGGGGNVNFTITTPGTYTIQFNDITHEYAINFTPSHQNEMYVAGSFTGWAPKAMTLENDVWKKAEIDFTAGAQEMKFANTNNWTGNDWGNAEGTENYAQETTGGGANIQFNIETPGKYTVEFNDMTLYYQIYTQLGVNSATKSNVKIYPIPAEKSIFVKAQNETIRSFEIYDMSGKLARKGTLNCKDCEITISGLPKGSYILNLTLDQRVAGQKIIIK